MAATVAAAGMPDAVSSEDVSGLIRASDQMDFMQRKRAWVNKGFEVHRKIRRQHGELNAALKKLDPESKAYKSASRYQEILDRPVPGRFENLQGAANN